MTTPAGLCGLSLSELARAVAARGPVPGSGSVAAAVGALGAGLASMALGSARGEGLPRGDDVPRYMEELLALVQADADAYSEFLRARQSGAGVDEAVERSIAVPARIAALALEALEGLLAGFQTIRPRLHSEAATSAQALLAAVEGATFTARANLPGLSERAAREQRAAELARLAERARESAGRLRELLSDPAR